MDLQAILDDSDSSSYGEPVFQGGPLRMPTDDNDDTNINNSNYYKYNSQKPSQPSGLPDSDDDDDDDDEGPNSNTSHFDIEDILREVEDDDDDDDDRDLLDNDDDDQPLWSYAGGFAIRSSHHNNNTAGGLATRHSHATTTNGTNNKLQRTDQQHPVGGSRSPVSSSSVAGNRQSSRSTQSSSQQQQHNPQHWAVLQQILNEDDMPDDDDATEEWIQTSSSPTAHPNPQQQQSSSSSSQRHLFVEHQTSQNKAEDGNDDNRDGVDAPSASAVELHTGSSQQQQRKPDPDAEQSSEAKHNASRSNSKQQQHGSSFFRRHDGVFRNAQKPTTAAKATAPAEPLTTTTTSTATTKMVASGIGYGQDRSAVEEAMYRRSLAAAQTIERKLLHGGGGGHSHAREIVSPLMIKRRLKPKIELSARFAAKQRSEQPHPSQQQPGKYSSSSGARNDRLSSAIPSSRFGFSGLVELKTMASVSASLVKHADPTATKVLCGLPTCLAFNSKFIAIGTQLGIILIFDLFEVLRQRLGALSTYDDSNSLDRKAGGSITSLDLSHNGDTVVAGYASGVLVLWDTIRGTILRSVNDSHPSPITAVRFVAELKIVTVDSGGLVHKLSFTKNLLWANYSVEMECLLDGTAGQILAMHVLPAFGTVKPLVRPDAFAKALRNLSLIALSSERSSFTVAVEPKINVLHRWGRPPTDLTKSFDSSSNKTYLPCLSWGWALVAGGGNVVMPVLARAWGCCLQLLCTSFPTLDDAAPVRIGEEPVVHWPAFGVHKEIDAVAPVIALEWLNDRSMAFLTASYEFTLVDTVMMTLQERLDFSGLKLVYAEFSLSRAAARATSDVYNSSSCNTFLNSTRCSDDRIMVICQDELKCISIVGARRRISALEADGEWLEALAFALDHYENTVISQEDRRRDPLARKDLSRHPEFSAAKSDEEEWIAKLLVRYLNLAVDNAPESSLELNSPFSSTDVTSRINLAQSHFQMLAGVCVEFCVAMRRLDLLFGPIFRRFQSVGFVAVFLDVLEPYVLNDKLKYIAPEVMSLFVGHCKATNGIATVERCLLHMDCTIMDFDSILSLLRTNDMYSALFYIFNQGLDDFVSPLEFLLERIFQEADTGGASSVRRNDGALNNDFERLGFKALLYLQTCFSGKSFPKEDAIEPEDRSQSLKLDLLKFLLQENFTPSSYVKKTVNLLPIVGQRALPFPYMRLLLLVDPRGMLDTISKSLDVASSFVLRTRSASGSIDDWVDGASRYAASLAMLDIQEIMIDLATILLPKASDQTQTEATALESRGAINAFLDFASLYVINGAAHFEKPITFSILSRVAKQYASAGSSDGRLLYQRKIMDILSALPRDSYEPDDVLAVFNETGMHRAALLLHQQVASSWHDSDQDDVELRSRHFLCAIDCYAEDEDPMFRLNVFNYVRKECSGVADTSVMTKGSHPTSVREVLFNRLPVLVHLDALMTARVVAELFIDDLDRVIVSLENRDGGRGQFKFLQAIIGGELGQVDPVAGSVLNLSMEHHHMYLALMADLHPEMVYEYLSKHNNYRTEEALRLCEEHDIADASAYLLERMGKVTNALQLILQTLETRMMGLKRSIRGLGVDMIRHHVNRPFSTGRHSRHSVATMLLPSKHENDVNGVRRILIVALDVCERNSGTFSSASSESKSKFLHGELWFSVLDRLINAKGFLRLSKELPEHANIMAGVLSELLHLTMERMVSSVPLTDLVRKVTSDHSGSQICELREMVQGLLATYGFELNVFKGAIKAFHDDVHAMKKKQIGLQVHGGHIQTLMNSPLTQNGSAEHSHPSILFSVLRVSGNGNATLIENDRYSQYSRAENGLVDAMKRLRLRRKATGSGAMNRNVIVSTTKNPALGGSSSVDIDMMTVDEQMFRDKETEPVLYTDRLVGALGDAEHRGQLVTFGRY